MNKKKEGYTPIGALRQNFNERATQILARTFYRELKQHGYTPEEIIALATELIDLVGEDLDEKQSENSSVSDL